MFTFHRQRKLLSYKIFTNHIKQKWNIEIDDVPYHFFPKFLLEFQLKNLNLIENEIKSILTKMCSSKVLLILILFNVPKKENNFQTVFLCRNWIWWFIDFDFIPNKPKIRWITFNFELNSIFVSMFCFVSISIWSIPIVSNDRWMARKAPKSCVVLVPIGKIENRNCFTKHS